jgi:hypothetical protein
MTIETILYRFRVRGGTAAALAALNEVPLARELVFETDTGRSKLGDGATQFNALPYVAGGSTIELRATSTHVQWRPEGGPTWFDLVALEDLRGEDGNDGDDGADGREVEIRRGSTHLQWRYAGDLVWIDLIPLADLEGEPGPAGPSSSCFPTATFDGGLGDIAIGAHCDLFVPFGFSITRATLLGDAPGTLQIDVRAVSYASHPPGPTNTICGGSPPTLASSSKAQDAVLSGWTTTIAAGTVMRFIVTASEGVKRANLVLEGERT